MTMNNIVVKYPLDLTGMRPENLVNNESHLIPRENSRGIAPLYGAYFTASLKIIHAETGYLLLPHIDYLALHLYEKATRATGQEVCAAIQIINEALDGEFLVTYQVVGGEFSSNVSVIEELLAALDLDDRPVSWGDILGKPNAFPPSDHLHDIDDMYGFEYMVEALERIRSAILIGDYYDHEEIRQRIENLKLFLLNEDQKIIQMLDTHTHDYSNPHNTTKAQVGLGLVDNFATATQVEAEAGVVVNKFMTPQRTKQAITAQAISALNTHIADKANPHQTTKAQVGLGSVQDYGIAALADAQSGSSNILYMTPLRTKDAITFQAIAPLNTHKADTNNPHATTKAQVGLGLVDNFATASTAEAQAGVANDKFMTPQRTAEAITTQAGALLNTHIADKLNPHAVTKAQVGLGSVLNYGLAVQTEAEAGTANTKYMTPLSTKQAISYQAITPLNTHINNKTNPHAVTKAQVGLGSVLDYGLAIQTEAEAGTLNTKYMTPLSTKQAITYQAVTPLTTHINNKTNPHAVTKTQVGLGNVLDYGLALQTEAEAGTLNTKYMTPLLVKYAISSQALTPLTTHINNKTNPHAVTKTQVGLGSVQDYGIAIQAEAEAGTLNTKYMTPQMVKYAIASQALIPLGNHTGATNNPHGVTKTQVGLSNVLNYGIATQTEAEAGTLNTEYMTPLTTKQAITYQAISALNTHKLDTTNPHDVTKAQVGLSNVGNYSFATQAEAQAGASAILYMSPVRTNDLISVRLGSYVPTSAVSGGGGWSTIVDKIPKVQSNGVLEIGRYIDFHYNGDEGDYSLRYEVRGSARGGYEIYNTGYYNCQDFYIRSDIRDKTNITQIKNARGIISELGGYHFNLHGEEFLSAGVLAQRVQEHFPSAVIESKNGEGEDRLVVSNTAMVGLLVQHGNEIGSAVSELETKFQKVCEANDRLTKLVYELSARLEVLEAK